MAKRPFVLIICDGWGELPHTKGNAITHAKTPRLDALRSVWPHTTVQASGEAVGLPKGQIGNSEVGHLTIGAGRVIRQPLARQLYEVESGEFYDNTTLKDAIIAAKQHNKRVHVLGLVSEGGVHSHQVSAVGLAELAKRLDYQDMNYHVFTDGRDTSPQSALTYVKDLQDALSKIGVGTVRSVAGRYYAMDRDNRWDRIERAYDVLTGVGSETRASALDYIQQSYDAGVTDEFITPMAIEASASERVFINDGDTVIFFNFRADRARQLCHALVDKDFTEFTRKQAPVAITLVTFSEYDSMLSATVAFPTQNVDDTLAEVIATAGLRQYHSAETEKYAHVTYFFNGGKEAAFKGEDRKLIPSLKVATYDLAPKMSARAVTDDVVNVIGTDTYDFIVVNLANADMVGHTGKFDETVQAIEYLDGCIADIVDATLGAGGVALMTADHGNAEVEIDPHTGGPVTAHTTSPVPVVVCGITGSLRSGGALSDVAPTVLDCMGLEKPVAMTGTSLIV